MTSLRVNHCIALLSLLLLSPTASLAQSSTAKPPDASSAPAVPTPPPTFEIADVHPSSSVYLSANTANIRWNPQGTDRFLIHQASLLDLIDFAYKLDSDHVLGGPTSLGFNRYEIVAKQPPATPVDTTRLMVRALLADRFKLVAHEETRPMPAQILTVSKGGPKMNPAENTAGPSQCQAQRPPALPAPDAPPPTGHTFFCRNFSMQQYAHWITLVSESDNPVVDQTGLKGAWDFNVTYAALPVTNSDLQRIGLNLAIGKTPQQTLVIERVHETPTPNSPKLAELLPPPPLPAFDVAVIKPDPSGDTDMNLSVSPSGQVTITHANLQILIGTAFNMSGASIADVPDFVAKDRWDVIGKIPQDAYPKGSNGALIVSQDDTHLMIRSLLVERFGLKAHLEDRPADGGWSLTAVHPRLKKTADTSVRTSCSEVPPPGEKDPRSSNSIRNHAIWCRNITLAQFASQLMPHGWDFNIKSAVVDETHLAGSYDIVLNWSSARFVRANVTNAASDAVSEVADPSGAISLQDAVSQQLGLKLKTQRQKLPRIVIDHIERNPTQN